MGICIMNHTSSVGLGPPFLAFEVFSCFFRKKKENIKVRLVMFSFPIFCFLFSLFKKHRCLVNFPLSCSQKKYKRFSFYKELLETKRSNFSHSRFSIISIGFFFLFLICFYWFSFLFSQFLLLVSFSFFSNIFLFHFPFHFSLVISFFFLLFPSSFQNNHSPRGFLFLPLIFIVFPK